MNKVIIFEGPDSSGKTTIAKALAKKYGYSYFKNKSEQFNFTSKSFQKSAFIEAGYLIGFLQQVKVEGGVIILDRHMPSEYVYSKTFNRKTNEEAIWMVDEQLALLGAIVIYCYKDSYDGYADEIIDMKKVGLLKQHYEEYFNKTAIPTLRLETSDENLDEQIEEINIFLISMSED